MTRPGSVKRFSVFVLTGCLFFISLHASFTYAQQVMERTTVKPNRLTVSPELLKPAAGKNLPPDIRVKSQTPFYAGKAVEFIIEPVIQNMEYLFDFGDNEQSGWVKTNEISHVYKKAGDFKAKALIRVVFTSASAVAALPKPIETNSVSVRVAEPEPEYRMILKTDKRTIRAGESISFEAVIEPSADNVRYSYRFGDSRQNELSDSSRISHTYKKPGRYIAMAAAVINDQKINSARIQITVEEGLQKPSAEIVPETVTVRQGERAVFESVSTGEGNLLATWRGPLDRNHRGKIYNVETGDLSPGEFPVILRVADKNQQWDEAEARLKIIPPYNKPDAVIMPEFQEIKRGETAVFESMSAFDPDLPIQEYWYGPRTPPARGKVFELDTSELEPGTYEVKLEIKDEKDQSDSAAASFRVVEKAPYYLNFSVFPKHPEPGSTVTFTANLRPDENAEYRFIFGDGTLTEWGPFNKVTHVYDNAGNYQASAVSRLTQKNNEEIYSGKIIINITSSGGNSWIWIAGGIIVIGSIGALLTIKLRNPSAGKIIPPEVSFRPRKGSGLHEVKVKNSSSFSIAVRLKHVKDKGKQTLKTDGPLVKP